MFISLVEDREADRSQGTGAQVEQLDREVSGLGLDQTEDHKVPCTAW
jgi:hypothetical protein